MEYIVSFQDFINNIKIKPDDGIMTSKQEDKITEYKGYKIGDAVIVKNKPI